MTMTKMKIKNKAPLYIAVQLENGDKRVWLPLPANKKRFAEAIEKIGDENGDFKIREYNCRIPAMSRYTLMKTPLSVVNYFASRLNKLTDDEVVKLCAVSDSDHYFDHLGQYIDFTFHAPCYDLLQGITDEEALGGFYLQNQQTFTANGVYREGIGSYEFGRRIAEAENGAFTALGYLTSSIGWDLMPEERIVPDSLRLKGVIGEDLYGDWDEYDISV